MRKLIMLLTAASVAMPMSLAVPTSAAQARHRHHRHYTGYAYRHQRTCRYSSGTTGLVAGGVGGALVGRSIVGHGLLGTAAGAVGGAIAGRAIDRAATAPQRCY
jgi:uncharacterized protein YcfJ